MQGIRVTVCICTLVLLWTQTNVASHGCDNITCHVTDASQCNNSEYPEYTHFNKTGGKCDCAACEKLVEKGGDCRDPHRRKGYYVRCVGSTCNRQTRVCE